MGGAKGGGPLLARPEVIRGGDPGDLPMVFRYDRRWGERAGGAAKESVVRL